MRVRCDEDTYPAQPPWCGKTYNDETHWGVCPHPPRTEPCPPRDPHVRGEN